MWVTEVQGSKVQGFGDQTGWIGRNGETVKPREKDVAKGKLIDETERQTFRSMVSTRNLKTSSPPIPDMAGWYCQQGHGF